MAEHTPAPWNAATAFSSVVGAPIIAQNGQRIGNTAMPNMPADMPPEWDEFKQRAVANAAFIVNNEAIGFLELASKSLWRLGDQAVAHEIDRFLGRVGGVREP